MRLALGATLVAAMYAGILALLVTSAGWTGVLLFVAAVVVMSVLGVGAFKVTARGRANAPPLSRLGEESGARWWCRSPTGENGAVSTQSS